MIGCHFQMMLFFLEVDKKVNDDGKVKTLKDFSVKELNKKLTDSIAEENYEFAARVRDEIKRRN